MANYGRTLLLLLTLATLVLHIPAQEQEQQAENIPAVLAGLRANAIEGDVVYIREDGKFNLETGHEVKHDDVVRTGSIGRAELLLQPGNLLRFGANSECRFVDDRYDRLKLLLNKGAATFELLRNDWEDSTMDFFESLRQGFELIRIITPNSEIFITQPGIFRINVSEDRTEIVVRKGEALIDGRRVKEKRSAVAARGSINITEIDTKVEDPFDAWCRERSEKVIATNHSLKKDAPWAKQKERDALVDMPASQLRGGNPYVVSAKPGAVNFVEHGVEFSARQKPWEPLTDKSLLSAGDKLRTNRHCFVELTMFPDLYLRLNGESEVSFEQLSNESIVVKVLRGSAILDVARFDRKEMPEIVIGGPSNSVVIDEDGNYRVNVRSGNEEIMVRKGKVIFQERSIGDCRIISGGNTSVCDGKPMDNFDAWSQHRGEGQFFNGTAMATRLGEMRRRRFKTTGFWYQHVQLGQYTFVPFTSTYFRSPYGGKYSSVLSPRLTPMYMWEPGIRSRPGRVP